MVSVEWGKNERVVEMVLAGKSDVTEDYDRACIFFQRLTGIKISGNLSYVGVMPDSHSAEDFRKIKLWYKNNRQKLCWDWNSESVKACGNKKSNKSSS
jgi:hypothetical protein